MQVDFDVDVLMASLQTAAMRRGLFVAYMPLIEKWTVNNPIGGEVVGSEAQLEKIFGVLDQWEIVNNLPDLDDPDITDHLLLHPRQADFSPARRREDV